MLTLYQKTKYIFIVCIFWVQTPKRLMCIPEKKKPLIPFEINGFLNLVAGTGFEPVTFGL